MDTTATSRQPQVIEVLASEPGSGVGNDGAVDRLAVSEAVVLGTG